MRFARLSLILAALGLTGFGVPLLVKPSLLGIVGVELGRPAAATEIRAFYGGLELGLAAFFIAACRREAWLRPALFAQAAGFGGIVAARVIGIAGSMRRMFRRLVPPCRFLPCTTTSRPIRLLRKRRRGYAVADCATDAVPARHPSTRLTRGARPWARSCGSTTCAWTRSR